MFRRKENDDLQRLQRELLAAEDEDTTELDLEALEEFLGEETEYEADAQETYEEYFDSQYEEEYTDEPFYRNHANGYGSDVKNYANRYGKGSPKKFGEDVEFDDTFDDSIAVYRDDYRKAKKKKKRSNLGLVILAILEIIAIAAIALWWASWML